MEPSATFIKQVISGDNGTRIYYWNNRYYCVDGEFDCRRNPEELPGESWGIFKTLEAAEKHANDQ